MKSSRYHHIAELRRQQAAAKAAQAKPERTAQDVARWMDDVLGAKTERQRYAPERRMMARRANELRHRETWTDPQRATRIALLLHSQIVLANEAYQGPVHERVEADVLRKTVAQAARVYRALERRVRERGWLDETS